MVGVINDGNAVYTPSHEFHYLLSSFFTATFPACKVKEEWRGKVRIAACHNLGLNMIQYAKLMFESKAYQEFDNRWLDVCSQWYSKGTGPGHRESFDRDIGNVKCMEEWSETLPNYPLLVEQPWYYSQSKALAFPLRFCKSAENVPKHHYILRTKVVDLIRVQRLYEGVWINVSPIKFTTYVDFSKEAIQDIKFWGRYDHLTKEELAMLDCNTTPQVFLYRSVVAIDTPNDSKYGETPQVTLAVTQPARAMFWMVANKTAETFNCRSNYTTNSNSLYAGWDPIKYNSLEYGSKEKFKAVPSLNFGGHQAREHFPSAPSEQGYHAFSWAETPGGIHGDRDVCLARLDAKFSCLLHDGDIFKVAEREEESEVILTDASEIIVPKNVKKNSPDFRLIVRVEVIRRLTIRKTKDKEYSFELNA